MQRLFNLDKWSRLAEGQALAFSNPRPRNVRLELNAPVKTALWYVSADDGETYFLALVEGRDTVEFGCTGAFQITVEGHDCWVYTADGDDISSTVVAPRSFTKIVERRRRNPELEQIAALMQRNMERRLEQQAHELEQLFARRAADAAAISSGTSATGDVSSQSTSAGDTLASSPVAATTETQTGDTISGGTT